MHYAHSVLKRVQTDLSRIKPVKRFQMKSNGCRDVQHTGLQSTQTRRNTGKQGAQTRGTRSAHLPKHPYISGCIIIVGYANQFKVTKNLKKMLGCKSIQGYKKLKKMAWLLDMRGATDVGMLGKMCRSSAPCLCTLLTSVPSCLCAL